jgi:hypothetical protein
MNKLIMTVITAAIGLTLNIGATADDDWKDKDRKSSSDQTTMSREDYRAEKEAIETQHRSAERECRSMSGNARDICQAEADAKAKIRNAELEAAYQPSEKADYNVSIAKAEATYAIAKEKCDDEKGNAKDVCVKDAQAAETASKKDAKAEYRAATSDDKRDARSARNEADEDKREARYVAAKERCESLDGDARDQCKRDVKEKYGR